jgi:ABC-type transporter Mla subunit MlaD
MSYESVREHLARFRSLGDSHFPKDQEFLDALEELTAALEADLTQIKAALSHVASLLEAQGEGREDA